ncbi:MAG: SusC/RagA family TonB-linked outer membrane protein, partial [Alistipes sp.]|nr:SusC/RagA family TonB-linked outer membrane protein [Alistipes sp.]
AFTLQLPQTSPGAILVVSFIGYEPQEIAVGSRTNFQVTLQDSAIEFDDVVVTALGIRRSEKALSYNVQQINADDIVTNKDANFVNSLSGKVAGVTFNASSSGVGGATKVVMRGTKSILQSSNALYVIDGVPMFAPQNEGSMEFGSQGATEPIADINPEDIESISVLNGAAAAALYGSDAANGVIVITTKRGTVGKLTVTVTSNTEIMSPFVMPRFQTRYGTGDLSSSETVIDKSWGHLLNQFNYRGYSPTDDYFRTGVTGTETVSLSTGSERNQTYLSSAAVNSRGIFPNNKYDRYNFTFRNTTSFLEERMTLDVGASYIKQEDRNMTNQGIYNNPVVGAYLFPRGNDWSDIKMYERYDVARKIYTQYWPVGDAGMTMQNPYWINYRNLRENSKDRYMLNASLKYDILDWLNVSGRVRMDNSVNDYTEKYYASTNTQLTGGSNRGYYGITRTKDKQLYADVLVNISKTFGTDWTLNANIGSSISDLRSDGMRTSGPIADESFDGEQVGLTNFFAVQNLSKVQTENIQEGWREQTQSIFASVEVGYKGTYYLTVTGRNDWPSQLAGPLSTKSSYFYPSVGGSVIISEIIPNMPKDLSFLKLRGSFASVGVAFERYIANPKYEWSSNRNQWSITTQYPIENLLPERTNSVEVGITMRFLRNFNLDFSFYNTVTKNQTFDPDLSVSQWSNIYLQSGSVRNRGVELSLSYRNTWNDFTWDSGYTFSANRNKILSLADHAINPVTGEVIQISTLNMGGLGSTRFLLRKGGTMGDLYSLIDLKRDSNNDIYIDHNDNISTETIQNPDNYIKLGSVLPDANMAWRNSFSWRNLSFGFMVSARLGGVVFSRTQAMLDYYGVSEASAAARDRGYVLINGDNHYDPQRWYTAIGGGTAVPQYYTYSATNVRLQEASIGYTIPRKLLGEVCDITVSLVGRNLWMLYNKAPFDPESVASTNNFYQGIA